MLFPYNLIDCLQVLISSLFKPIENIGTTADKAPIIYIYRERERERERVKNLRSNSNFFSLTMIFLDISMCCYEAKQSKKSKALCLFIHFTAFHVYSHLFLQRLYYTVSTKSDVFFLQHTQIMYKLFFVISQIWYKIYIWDMNSVNEF